MSASRARACARIAAFLAVLALPASALRAHPMGNFSISHHTSIEGDGDAWEGAFFQRLPLFSSIAIAILGLVIALQALIAGGIVPLGLPAA